MAVPLPAYIAGLSSLIEKITAGGERTVLIP